MRGMLLAAVATLALAAATTAAGGGSAVAALAGRAVLAADTFASGPASGSRLGTAPITGRTPPFATQPVQGFSALLAAGSGTYWAMTDNGFGNRDNSPDFRLRVYRVRPDFETAAGGSGTVALLENLQLSDPDRRIPFEIVNNLMPNRRLTGADFDPESFRRDRSGTFWFGDEFGPWLLHTDANGRVLEAPIGLAGVKAPENRTLGSAQPTLPHSRGFEGMAVNTRGTRLYPMLEGALTADPDTRRRTIHEFDIPSRRYTGKRWQYHTEVAGHSISDLAALDDNRMLVIERDTAEGAVAAHKRIYLVDLRRLDAQGFLVKQELVDLLALADRAGISLPPRPGDIGLGTTFSMPFKTIEAVLPVGQGRLLVVNDNNYPWGVGRNPGRPDDNEFVLVDVPALG